MHLHLIGNGPPQELVPITSELVRGVRLAVVKGLLNLIMEARPLGKPSLVSEALDPGRHLRNCVRC